MSEHGSLRQRRTSTLTQNGVQFPGGRPSPIQRPASYASVRSTNLSETDHSEILSPTPRRHYLLQQQSSQWLQSPGNISPPVSRPSSPLNPNGSQSFRRKHQPSLSLSSFAEGHAKSKEGRISGVNGSLARRLTRWMHKNGFKDWVLPVQILCALWVKWAVGLGSYSGQGTPPMYGDYEAQRHWLEITFHLPIRMWYKYDLQYWGLDYPPLTAYVSWVCGYIANKLNPSWVALDESRGIETPSSKVYMRATVLALDCLVYLPAIYCFMNSSSLRHRSLRARHVALAILLFQPALILVDSGHFQYNSVMLGLMLQALNFFAQGSDLLGALCFVGSLGFKQMALYYSPVVFSYLLGKCLLLGWNNGFRHLVMIGIITISAFIVLFLPFLYPSFPTHVIPPIQRIFPFARGLFEDKVANFWCASNVFFKWNNYLPKTVLPKLATGMTALAFIPSMWALLAPGISSFGCMDGTITNSSDAERSSTNQNRHPSKVPAPTFTLFTHALFQCSLSFFLFSFQVHEKTILVPLLPATLIMTASAPTVEGGDWEWGVLLNNVACFSMWPLLKKDGLALQYFTLVALWNHVIGHNPFRQTTLKLFTLLIYVSIFVLHLSESIITPPARYPDLFPVLNAMLCAGVFGLAYLWSVKRLVELSWAMGSIRRPSSSPTSRSNQVAASGIQHHGSSAKTSALHPNMAANPPRERVVSLSAASTSDSLRKRNAAGTDGHIVDLSASPR